MVFHLKSELIPWRASSEQERRSKGGPHTPRERTLATGAALPVLGKNT